MKKLAFILTLILIATTQAHAKLTYSLYDARTGSPDGNYVATYNNSGAAFKPSCTLSWQEL